MESQIQDILDFVPTGINGVDELLGGKGIPKGYIVILLGSPGSGKTIFAIQFLYKGATLYNEPGVYVTLDEHPTYVKIQALGFGWNLEEVEKENKLIMLDGSPIRTLPGETKIGGVTIGRKDFSLISLVKWIKDSVSKINAKRLVIDPINVFTVQYPNEAERRFAMMELMHEIAETGCTTLLISELMETGIERHYQFEEYLAQGVILIRKVIKPGGVARVFQIEKMRCLEHDTQAHAYKITQNGIEVYPSELAI
jgi:KaiC/GvpD/RAD55 family RecA-like ATPase